MNTNRWKHGDTFPLLDLVADFSFRTPSSIGFLLGTDEPLPEHGLKVPCTFAAIGWVDVHHACEGFIKTQVRVCLPERYLDTETMQALQKQIVDELDLPGGETFQLHCIAASKSLFIEQTIDRNGMRVHL